jgi:hypothetical protein
MDFGRASVFERMFFELMHYEDKPFLIILDNACIHKTLNIKERSLLLITSMCHHIHPNLIYAIEMLRNQIRLI